MHRSLDRRPWYRKARLRTTKRREPSKPAKGARQKPKPKPKRVRRSAEEARASILDAADKRLASSGPSGIRLQEIASDVGMSHPTVLHHFGNREALVEAVVQRALDGLQKKLLASFRGPSPKGADGAAMFRQIMDTLADRGHARLMAWLSLEGRPADDPDKMLRSLAEAMHATRTTQRRDPAPPFEDTLFVVLLGALALFGEGVLGDTMLDSAGLPAPARDRFHDWFVALLTRHLEGPGIAGA
ncbi:MAG: TetR/AcrR family transcriptional regulator [Polyangiaceae bacterium]|nr:TetR/AcrR family transcriptional regulator [Polyangiaceae bacterium]